MISLCYQLNKFDLIDENNGQELLDKIFLNFESLEKDFYAKYIEKILIQ